MGNITENKEEQMSGTWHQCGAHLSLPWVAAHEEEPAEPPIDNKGTDDADDHDHQDDGALVENVCEAATVYLVHAQEEP